MKKELMVSIIKQVALDILNEFVQEYFMDFRRDIIDNVITVEDYSFNEVAEVFDSIAKGSGILVFAFLRDDKNITDIHKAIKEQVIEYIRDGLENGDENYINDVKDSIEEQLEEQSPESLMYYIENGSLNILFE